MPKNSNRSALTKKAQVTKPKKIRNFLGLRPGDAVEFVVRHDEVKIVPLHSDLEGSFGKIFPDKRPENFNIIRSLTEEQIAKETANRK